MPLVLRWGRSAYETDADLGLERDAAHALGLDWEAIADRSPPSALARADALVVNSGVRVDAAVLDALKGRLVITTTSGFDHVDTAAARERGTTVLRCPMARRDAVVETTLAGILGIGREIPRLHDASARGHWARGDLPELQPILLRESTVVAVGAGGVIGREVCARLLGLGARVIGVDPAGVPQGVASSSLNDALPRAEVLTLHCHLATGSERLIDRDALDRLPAGATVVNTARGRILDVDATVAAVADGRLRGALIDVFPTEPWPGLADAAAVPGVRLLPHAAGYTPDLGARVAQEVAAALGSWVAGDPLPNVVC